MNPQGVAGTTWRGADRWPVAVGALVVLVSRVLTAQVPADKIAAAGTANVTVFNPAPGGGESQQLTLTIRKALHSIYLPGVIR